MHQKTLLILLNRQRGYDRLIYTARKIGKRKNCQGYWLPEFPLNVWLARLRVYIQTQVFEIALLRLARLG
ncbi:MAG: hypothetical protein A6F71_10205 [Cycloclasticus sp. symbiont of Poecilosclerida sp. M]|nr:MAG: hypothetical protein A6F71_10205 [Cycloclasticus sp. symbiont of Poecilosclerida sp. M]